MATIGTFKKTASNEFTGEIVTLSVRAKGVRIIADARATGEPVTGTVLVTGAAGWLFGWLAERSGSLAAPMLVHLAINEAGALAALAVQRRSTLRRD